MTKKMKKNKEEKKSLTNPFETCGFFFFAFFFLQYSVIYKHFFLFIFVIIINQETKHPLSI